MSSVLLIRPPAFDVRLPWSAWQNPTYLSRAAAFFAQAGAHVWYIDALCPNPAGSPPRSKEYYLDLDGVSVEMRRYGLKRSGLARRLKAHVDQHGQPHWVLIEYFCDAWKRGVDEVVQEISQLCPMSQVAIVGSDALRIQHFENAWPGKVISWQPPERVRQCSPAWSLNGRLPVLGYLSSSGGVRSAGELLEDIERGLEQGVGTFTFSEHDVLRDRFELFLGVLEGAATMSRRQKRPKFVAVGNIDSITLARRSTEHPDLFRLMRRAGFRRLNFADDRHLSVSDTERLVDSYRIVSERGDDAGFQKRTDALVAGLCLGRAGEELEQRVGLATRLAHIVGGIIVWPYHPAREECNAAGLSTNLELQNGKLFPLRGTSGATYRDYLRVIGLCSVLNAKYRERTFDFSGAGRIAVLFRESLAREAWRPAAALKGSLKLPLLPSSRSILQSTKEPVITLAGVEQDA